MSEIEITLPTVQYGNVKVRATPEELGLHGIDNSYELGAAAAVYLNLFTQGFKVGASMEVVPGLQEVSQKALSASKKAGKEAVEAEAQRLLDEGLGGVTEVRSVEQIMSDEDVDTVEQARKFQESEVKAPWNSTVDAKPKPWEAEATAPKAVVVTAEW